MVFFFLRRYRLLMGQKLALVVAGRLPGQCILEVTLLIMPLR